MLFSSTLHSWVEDEERKEEFGRTLFFYCDRSLLGTGQRFSLGNSPLSSPPLSACLCLGRATLACSAGSGARLRRGFICSTTDVGNEETVIVI